MSKRSSPTRTSRPKSSPTSASASVTEGVVRTAEFDASGKYRYHLTRRWTTGRGHVVFVLLNPSTADEHREDPTVRRCMGYARRWGARELRVVNVFAYRATKPADMLAVADPVGPENDEAIRSACKRASRVVFGWGAYGSHMNRSTDIVRLLKDRRPYCLGVTSLGEPRHPLYLRADAEPVPFMPMV